MRQAVLGGLPDPDRFHVPAGEQVASPLLPFQDQASFTMRARPDLGQGVKGGRELRVGAGPVSKDADVAVCRTRIQERRVIFVEETDRSDTAGLARAELVGTFVGEAMDLRILAPVVDAAGAA